MTPAESECLDGTLFFADECHELKGGATAQGVALGALAAAADRTALLTGTLFAGLAADVYSAAFVDLEEVAPWLPRYTEIPDPITMADNLWAGYARLQSTLEVEAKAAARRGGMSVYAARIQTGLGRPDMGDEGPAVVGRDGALLCIPPVVAPDPASGLYPKEHRLLEVLERERDRGRK